MKRSRHKPDGTPFVCQERGEVSMHFGMGAVQSRMRVGKPDVLVLDYTRAMMSFLLFNPAPRDILMLGLGGGSLAKYCHAHLPNTRFTAVEINPEVIAMRGLFSIPPDDDRLRIACADGAAWVPAHPDSCDVLMLDGFGPEGLPPALSSQDFYDACARALQPGGVLVANIWAGPVVRDAALGRLRHSFDSGVVTLPAEEGENLIAFACRDAAMPDPDTLHARARELEAAHPIGLDLSAQRLSAALASPA